MLQCKKTIYNCTKAIFLAAFIVSLSFYPLDYTIDDEVKTTVTIQPDLFMNMNMPFYHMAYHSSLILIPQRDTYSFIEFILGLNRSARNNKNFVLDYFNLYNIIFTQLSVFAFLSSYRMTNNRISIIALKIGGHAPPFGLHRYKISLCNSL